MRSKQTKGDDGEPHEKKNCALDRILPRHALALQAPDLGLERVDVLRRTLDRGLELSRELQVLVLLRVDHGAPRAKIA